MILFCTIYRGPFSLSSNRRKLKNRGAWSIRVDEQEQKNKNKKKNKSGRLKAKKEKKKA